MDPVFQTPIVRMLAVALIAQESNGEYIGSNSFVPQGKQKNVSIMRQLIQENDPASWTSRLEAAEEMRAYCHTKMIELLSGNLTSYWRAILDVVAKEEIASNAFSDWGLIASIPSAYMRAVERENIQEAREKAALTSVHFGRAGDPFKGNVKLIGKMFSVKYNKTWYTGITDEGNLVNFPYANPLVMDYSYKVSGKIRKHGDSATTLLHYVRIEVDNAANDVNI